MTRLVATRLIATRLIATWLALLLLLTMEVAAAVLHRGWIGWIAAPAMIALIAASYMHLVNSSGLAKIFALAGVFWMLVLIGLGSADFVSRRDTPAGRHVGAEPTP